MTNRSIDRSRPQNRNQSLFTPPPAQAVGSPPWWLNDFGQYQQMHQQSLEDPEKFYSEIARELHWFTDFTEVTNAQLPDTDPFDPQWFIGGKTNLCFNCIDRQVEADYGDQVAIIWEGEPYNPSPEVRSLTYQELQTKTAQFGNMLRSFGITKGDVVTIYMGMVPELAIALLGCARIGAAHSVIFGGFSAQAIADRVEDAQSKVIITCDGLYRRGKVVPLKENVDSALGILSERGHGSLVEQIVCYKRCGNKIDLKDPRYSCWQDQVARSPDECPCEPLDAEDMSFLLYTSGSTGKPKGIKHTIGGYMVHTYLTAKYVFNLVPDQDQIYWCTADIGWITGHSYIIYGILPNRVPTVMYEGAPNFPEPDRFWDIVERHNVTQFYTAPTAIRAFMKWGDEHPKKHDLSSLQVLGTVGEPINPAAWEWYRETIGRNSCPIVDTYWQTETGGHMITPLPGVTSTKPGSCSLPFFGVDAAVVDKDGNELPPDEEGYLVIRKPWPSMLRGIYGDRERYLETYWSTIQIDGRPVYAAGDGARRDGDGFFWISGRIDDVMNISGHRLGTMEVESALVSHRTVVEAAVVGVPHEIKGTAVAAFVTLRNKPKEESQLDTLRTELVEHVSQVIGRFARPEMIRFTEVLPKTRSGKIMRRLLRDIAAGVEEVTQDTTTLEDYSVLAQLRES